MANGFSWKDTREDGGYHLPGPNHLGWWAAVAMLASILLHVLVFFALDKIKIALHFEQARELQTNTVVIRQAVEIQPEDIQNAQEPDITEPEQTAPLLEEVDILKNLHKELEMRPDVDKAEYALQMKAPAQEGDPAAAAQEAVSSMDIDGDMPELGRDASQMRPAEVGQVTVDPGDALADDKAFGKFTDDLIKKGAGGNAVKGALDGAVSMDEMLGMSSNALLGKKTMLPSDLLFEFNKADLRESAKVGLMKLGLLIDNNPKLYCWIEGHADLVGSDAFNMELSIRRAEAVKQYLVNSLRMDGSKIMTRGYGRLHPIVSQGNTEQQAINRRVEIKMRDTPPPTQESISNSPPSPRERPVVIVKPKPIPSAATPPPVAKPVEVSPQETAPKLPPKAVLVKPQRALPIAEPTTEAEPGDEPAPEAIPQPKPQRAEAVEDE